MNKQEKLLMIHYQEAIIIYILAFLLFGAFFFFFYPQLFETSNTFMLFLCNGRSHTVALEPGILGSNPTSDSYE